MSHLDRRTFEHRILLLNRWLNAGIMVGMVVQIYLAGWALFGAKPFDLHIVLGSILTLGALSVGLSSLGAGHRAIVGYSWLMALSVVLQLVLVAAWRSAPAIAALHPLNGTIALLLAIELERVHRLRRSTWLADEARNPAAR